MNIFHIILWWCDVAQHVYICLDADTISHIYIWYAKPERTIKQKHLRFIIVFQARFGSNKITSKSCSWLKYEIAWCGCWSGRKRNFVFLKYLLYYIFRVVLLWAKSWRSWTERGYILEWWAIVRRVRGLLPFLISLFFIILILKMRKTSFHLTLWCDIGQYFAVIWDHKEKTTKGQLIFMQTGINVSKSEVMIHFCF